MTAALLETFRALDVTGQAVFAQALGYAAAGWPVFPTRPRAEDCPDPGDCPCKRPLTGHGFQDASTDEAVIREWWRRWPRLGHGEPATDDTRRVTCPACRRPAVFAFEAFSQECHRLADAIATGLCRLPLAGAAFRWARGDR